MQVMPATARDPGFGIRPSNGTQADDVRVGRQYRAAMERKYGGDLAQMWGAYNAGPGRIDELVNRYGRDWLRYAPAETQAYVARNMRAVRS
jgi:soluble lytic murein transglycosylase